MDSAKYVTVSVNFPSFKKINKDGLDLSSNSLSHSLMNRKAKANFRYPDYKNSWERESTVLLS